MNSRRATAWTVWALVLTGSLCVGLRLYARHQMQLNDGDSVWRLTYTVEFRAPKAGARIRAALPADTEHSRVFRQDLLYSGMMTERQVPARSPSREVGLVSLHPGKYHLVARFDLHLTPQARWQSSEPAPQGSAPSSAKGTPRWLGKTSTIQVDSPAVSETLARLQRDGLKDEAWAQRLFDYCAGEIEGTEEGAAQDAASALSNGSAAPLGRVRAFVALCRASKIPARLVTGFVVEENSHLAPQTWAEVLLNEQWTPYDLENGHAGQLPANFVPVRRDGVQIMAGDGIEDLESTFSLVRLPPTPAALNAGVRSPLLIADLSRLPLEMHNILSLILLMPLGALVTAVFRTIIGVRTFGTFTPTLLALSFVFADWWTGILVFALVMGLGLPSRALLDRLKLLMVPRLSIVLTLVALCIVFTVSALDYFHLTPGPQAVLLPMVILTMTIERFYLTTEEDGPGFALRLMGGTILVGVCCYLVLRWGEVGKMLLAFPEVHFFTVAVLIAIGRYTGYRLTELWRFRDFTGPLQG